MQEMKEKDPDALMQAGARLGLGDCPSRSAEVAGGWINRTWKVTYPRPNGRCETYILQRINRNVFQNAPAVMENIEKVSAHIFSKRPDAVFPRFCHAPDGHNYFESPDGGFWRAYRYIDAETFLSCRDLQVLFEAGGALGDFQARLLDFDASSLRETIPGFHDAARYLERLHEAKAADLLGRAREVQAEFAYLCSMRSAAVRLGDARAAGRLPLRVTHNDTKLSNVLFDRCTHKRLTLVDLDTVMPGLAAYDFGDMVRSAAATAPEDAANASDMALDLAGFSQIAKGYLEAVGDVLTADERQSLASGVLAATLETAVRFLTDYIEGDRYFRIRYPEHNLVRARSQIALARSMEAHFAQMQGIICALSGG